jgi:hypothetical protein
MTSFGNVGHVLTNTGQNTNQTTANYECISVTNGIYLYELQSGSNGGDNIAYIATGNNANTWTANPSTDGNYDPSNFLSAGSNGSSIITPTNANTALHIGYGTTSTVWIASFSVVYSSGLGPPQTYSNNSGTITQNMDGSLSFQVSASSDSNETYGISLDNVAQDYIVPSGVGPWYHNYTFAEHSAIGYGTWTLYDQNGILDSLLTSQPATPPVVPPANTQKKVFCNFW